ncbi:hypothetical protein BH09PLA1_BH09PLA1_10140 [soil metagenome]
MKTGFLPRGVDRWLWSYLLQSRTRRAVVDGDAVHVLLCIADHFEPHNGEVDDERARRRVEAWSQQYPRLFSGIRDSDNRSPRHTFFYPLEQYERDEMDALAGLCRDGHGEVEVHLHHDHDTSDLLRARLLEYTHMLRDRHGLLAQRGDDESSIAYGFVHGNWALDNSRPDGRWCGVNNELDVLRETGCYADFTLPSAPSDTQTRTINSIYYAVDDPQQPRSHDTGVRMGAAKQPDNSLMLIQGPLMLNWRNRKWGVCPRIENACLQSNQYPSAKRLDLWLRARVQIAARPDWFFVKLHTHGATEANQGVLLGEPMVRFHRALMNRANENSNFHFHYVTAREMYNLARAAEAGWRGTVEQARDFELTWNRAAALAV